MVELLRNIVTDYLLFSLLEGYVFCKFFQVVGGCKKFKWWEVALLSLVNCIVSITLPPLIYQLVGLVYMGVYIYFRDRIKIKESIKIALLASLYMLIIEISYSILTSSIIKVNPFYTDSKMGVFILLIPARIIEILPLMIREVKLKMNVNSKWWVGDNIKRK